jgi:branched-chain amino acid transport system substrate-binding protein
MLLAAAAVLLVGGTAKAEITVKLGVMSDMSSLYADIGGPGSTDAAKMAVEDFDPAKNGMKVEVISADHLNKPDTGAGIARQWYDVDHVDAIVDVPTSSVALAIADVTKDKNKAFLVSGAASSDLTGAKCSPNTVHWTYDTWALAHGTGGATVKQGGDTWFFLTADYAFGHALERDTAEVVKATGGKVLGSVNIPLNTPDFSSFLLQAQSSKAKIIGLANAGGDTINAIKQAAEFGLVEGGQKMAGLLVFISDIHSLGLATAQGLTITTAFYWDLNDKTRAFGARFAKRNGGKYPSMVQAGVYAETLHYLEAVKKVGSAADGGKVVAAMKGVEYDDALFGKTVLREDGRAVHNMYLVEVKKPSESKSPYDVYKILATIPADQAFRPLADEKGACALVK